LKRRLFAPPLSAKVTRQNITATPIALTTVTDVSKSSEIPMSQCPAQVGFSGRKGLPSLLVTARLARFK